jgi:hypothetical protein
MVLHYKNPEVIYEEQLLWAPVRSDTTDPFHAVWADPSARETFIVGYGGRIYRIRRTSLGW